MPNGLDKPTGMVYNIDIPTSEGEKMKDVFGVTIRKGDTIRIQGGRLAKVISTGTGNRIAIEGRLIHTDLVTVTNRGK